MRLRLLRLFLATSAFAWGISVVGVFVPWSKADELLQGLGANSIPHDPMLDYWLRMASGAFFLVGMIFLALAIYPRRFASVIPLFGWFMVLEAIILAVHGFKLGLRPLPFYADTSACFLLGAGILALRNEAEAKSSESENS